MKNLMPSEEKLETVLVLQGGGSLGAYECGVYKALNKHEIKFDVVAGTSIGAINAAIISGHKGDEPAKTLEDFWLNLAETVTPSFLPENIRAFSSWVYSSIWGNPKAFLPVWFVPNSFNFFSRWPYLYDVTPLKKTLEEFVDFKKLKDASRPRMIITSTDIQRGKPSIFDSKYDNINADHVIASGGYPFYGISWTKINGKYLWDGTLLSNTPLIEVIHASPTYSKKIFVVDVFPHTQEEIPKNMAEAWHRARDIMFTDKTDQELRTTKTITQYLELLKLMHDILIDLDDAGQLDDLAKDKFKKLDKQYQKLAVERGVLIKEITRIERTEKFHFLFEDADFSLATIKQLIQDGEDDAEKALSEKLQD